MTSLHCPSHLACPSACLAAWLVVIAGCESAPSAVPSEAGRRARAGATSPANRDLLTQIDDALEHTYEHRRLSVGTTDQDQAAWQIIHGALAFKREFQVSDGEKDVSAVDYVLAGRPMKGLDSWKGTCWTRQRAAAASGRTSPGDKMGQGHTDQWMGYLSDCRLPLDEKIIVDGKEHTIADYIDQMKLDVHKNPTREYSWTLMALTAYYPTDYTVDCRRRQEWNIEKLVEIELEHDLDDSPCGGTHRMTALTMAYNRHVAAGGKDEGVWKTLRERIDKCVADAHKYQNPDGSLSSNYFLRPGKSADLAVAWARPGTRWSSSPRRSTRTSSSKSGSCGPCSTSARSSARPSRSMSNAAPCSTPPTAWCSIARRSMARGRSAKTRASLPKAASG